MVDCSILNRLRGTGVLKHFGTLRIGEMKIWKLTIPETDVEVKLVWNHVYGLYLALVFGLLAMNVWAGLAVFVAYLIGESKGWGEWVGALTRWEDKDEKWLQEQYDDKEGKGFPFIHIIANWINKEQIEGTLDEKLKQYNKYAITAIILRGMFWWGLVYMVMALFGVIGGLTALIATILLGVGFPIACELGKRWNYNKKYGVLSFSRGWENQEVVYGLMQGLMFWATITLSNLNF